MVLGMVILVIAATACAPVAVVWQGQYVSISTVDRPKEDFKVGPYIVIGYDIISYKKGTTSPYQFVIIGQGKQVGLITLDEESILEGFGFRYCLEEENVRRPGPIPTISASGKHVTYQMYKALPGYDKVKADVITVLNGQELEIPGSKIK